MLADPSILVVDEVSLQSALTFFFPSLGLTSCPAFPPFDAPADLGPKKSCKDGTLTLDERAANENVCAVLEAEHEEHSAEQKGSGG